MKLKIAWCRYNTETDLIGENKFGGVGSRVGFLRMLLDAGCSITIFTEFCKNTEKIYKKKRKFIPSEFRWMKELNYEPEGMPDGSYDLLIIDNSSGNLMFSSERDSNRCRGMLRVNNILRNYNGVVFYFQIDPYLPFIFNTERISRHFLINGLRFGTPIELLEGKRWSIITDIPYKKGRKMLRKFCNNNRSLYEELKIPVHFVPISSFQIKYRRFISEIKKYPGHFLTYIGNFRSGRRAKKLLQYYTGSKFFDTDIYGDFPEEFINRPEFKNVRFHGQIVPSEVDRILNDSVLQVVIADSYHNRTGHRTTRFLEVIMNRCIALLDEDIGWLYKRYYDFPEKYIISSKKELLDFVRILKNIGYSGRKKILEEQRSIVLEKKDYIYGSDVFFRVYQYERKKYEENKKGNLVERMKELIRQFDSGKRRGDDTVRKRVLLFKKKNYKDKWHFNDAREVLWDQKI